MLTILRRLAKEHDVFLWVGLGCSATFCLVGVLSLIFGQRPIRRSIHLAMMTSCVFAVSAETTGRWGYVGLSS